MRETAELYRAFHAPQVDPAANLRREFLDWAEPVIADCIFDRYRRDVEVSDARTLSAQHRRVWRALLLEHHGLVHDLRAELRLDLSHAGVTDAVAEAVDQSVFEELVDIVLRRFRASTEKAKQCSLILLGAATFMGSSRALA